MKNKIYPLKIGNIFKLSFEEEIGNSITHGIMAIFCLIMLPIVSVYGYIKHNIVISIGFSIYVICIFLMFLMSTLYHSMKFETNQKIIFRILDHCGIYLAIAGSFTPVCLKILDGVFLYLILIAQWGMVIIGIIMKSLFTKKKPKGSSIIYLVMGWSALLLIPSLIKTQSILFFILILFGGLIYSIGTLFYRKKDKAWFHFIWHIFVNIAAISQFIAIIFLLK